MTITPDLDKNRFDAALQHGTRSALAPANSALRRAEHDIFRMMLDDAGEFLPNVSYQRDCPLCNTPRQSATLALKAHGMHLLRCAGCKLVYSQEVITPEHERRRYQGSIASVSHFALKQDNAYAGLEREKARYVAGRLSSFAASGRLLDIGSSNGALLNAARDAGWTPHGIEINPAAADFCQARGDAVVCGEYPHALPADWNQFDAISVLDVLEHIAEPLDFLASLAQHLAPNGWLVVQVPNFNSLLIQIEGGDNSNIAHGHWSYFTPATLTATLDRAGFSQVFLETYISELDRILAYSPEQISSTYTALTGTTLDNPLELNTETLHNAMLGYKLFGIFRKR